MALHFIHVSKSGGSALRHAIRQARDENGGTLECEWGPIWGHDHRFRIYHVKKGEKAVFALRDPLTRFVSGFYSGLRKGAPRYDIGWSKGEAKAFARFSTPRELADALASSDPTFRGHAESAMRSIRHVSRLQARWTGYPPYLRKHIDKIFYVARQETLDEDWERLKELLDMPRHVLLPRDEVTAHKTAYPADRTLSEEGKRALREWYAVDYELLEIADDLRNGRSPAQPSIKQELKLALTTWVLRTTATRPAPKHLQSRAHIGSGKAS